MSNEVLKSEDCLCDAKRRDFVSMAAYSIAGVGAACALGPAIDSMNPAADTEAMSSIEVNVSALQPGQEMKVMWQGKPVFIKRRSQEDVVSAREVQLSELKDPQKDEDRVKPGKDEWLVLVGICTHLGCVPTGKGSGEYNGWFCACHGSNYDTSGRIRKGPAPKNLAVPPYQFLSDSIIKIG